MCVFQDTWTAVHRAASAEHADCSVEIIKIVVTTLMAREANLQSVAEYVNMRDQAREFRSTRFVAQVCVCCSLA